jgi:hypothetical protein
MKLQILLIFSAFASDENTFIIQLCKEQKNSENSVQNEILVKIEEDYYTKTKNYIGVTFQKRGLHWRVQRYSMNEKKLFYNGCYKDEKMAAYASDTLARKLIANGEKGHKLNFLYDGTEKQTSHYIGVSYNKHRETWCAFRRRKKESSNAYNGTYKDEETAAHASDTLARKLIANGEKSHKLNFPDNDTEFWAEEKSSNFIGVSYNKKPQNGVRTGTAKRRTNNLNIQQIIQERRDSGRCE